MSTCRKKVLILTDIVSTLWRVINNDVQMGTREISAQRWQNLWIPSTKTKSNCHWLRSVCCGKAAITDCEVFVILRSAERDAIIGNIKGRCCTNLKMRVLSFPAAMCKNLSMFFMRSITLRRMRGCVTLALICVVVWERWLLFPGLVYGFSMTYTVSF